MEKEKFKARFIEETRKPALGNVYGEYITQMSHFDRFVFVEGPGDIRYYSAYLPYEAETYIKCGGKSNVIHMHNYLDEHPEYTIKEKNYHYIVDKDYNELNNVKNLKKDHKISLTKYHSFENYAFEEENIKVILKFCGIEQIEEFDKYLKMFFEDVKLYEILQYLSTNNIIETKLPKLTEEQFTHDENNLLFIKNSFKEDVKKSLDNKKLKKKPKEFEEEYEKAIAKITKPIEIRGHDLELFMNEMLKRYEKQEQLIELLSNKDVLSKLHIEIDIK